MSPSAQQQPALTTIDLGFNHTQLSFVQWNRDIPTVDEIASTCKDNRFGVGKEQRHLLHKLVHRFRQAHGWHENEMPSNYPNETSRYRALLAGLRDEGLIRQLSSPRVYAQIRQAGRGRVSMAPLKGIELRRCCREIQAALVWRSRLDY